MTLTALCLWQGAVSVCSLGVYGVCWGARHPPMNPQEIVSVSNSWVNSVQFNPRARIWKPARPNAVIVVTPMAMCYPERPYAWDIRVSVDALAGATIQLPGGAAFSADTWNCPLKGRIIAQGGCVTTYVYFDIRSGSYTCLAPINSITIQMLESADPRFANTDISGFSVNGQVSNYPSASGTNGLTWTDYGVTLDNPSIVMPYSVAFTYSLADSTASAVPQEFLFDTPDGVLPMLVPPNVRTVIPGGARYFGPSAPGVSTVIVQHIDPSGAI